MRHKTRGIVFRFVKYKESSIIANVFTEKLGLQAYIVNGVRSKNPKNKIALFQPLTLLDMVVYHREHAAINRIAEVKCPQPYQTLPFDMKKSCMAMFIAEVLNKTIKEHADHPALFAFLHQSLLVLDHVETGYESFHLQFMLKLCRYLGFSIESSAEEIEKIGMDGEQPIPAKAILGLVAQGYDYDLRLTNRQRRNILEGIVNFYKRHLDIGEIQSIQVLRDLLA